MPTIGAPRNRHHRGRRGLCGRASIFSWRRVPGYRRGGGRAADLSQPESCGPRLHIWSITSGMHALSGHIVLSPGGHSTAISWQTPGAAEGGIRDRAHDLSIETQAFRRSGTFIPALAWGTGRPGSLRANGSGTLMKPRFCRRSERQHRDLAHGRDRDDRADVPRPVDR